MRNTRLHGLGFGLLVSLTLVSAGCFGGNADGGGTDGGTSCHSPADCSATQTCVKGMCVDRCQHVVCDKGQVCDDTDGSCVQCLTDKNCTGGGTCDTSTHTCSNAGAKGPACQTTADCTTRGQVCDNGTCQPAAGADCSKLACASGLDCLTFTNPNGGSAKLCMAKCSATSDCTDPTDVCDTGSGDAAQGHCVQNLCGPGLPVGFQGPVATGPGTFNGACNAAGTNDGTCWGPVDLISGFQIGLCVANGTVAAGGACDLTASYGQPGKLCNGGLCAPTSATGTQGVCLAFCTIADGQNCANVSGKPMACWPLPGNELGGLCFPQAASPGDTGSTGCTPFSPQTNPKLSCVADDACIAASGKNTCTQLCNKAAKTTTCASGTTCQADANGDKLLGNCK